LCTTRPNGDNVDLDVHIRVDGNDYNMPPPGRPFASGKTPNPYAGGGRTPGWGSSRTPNPHADSGRGWGSKTPNPYLDGGKTPAWSTSSKTPNPYAEGGKTPAWLAGSKTPIPYSNPSGGGWGGATPGRGASGWGGATPGRGANAWGGATPARAGWGPENDSNANSTSWNDNSFTASTPAAALTPGFGGAASAPTPGLWSAPTPGGYAAPTPGGYAPTPGSGGYGAPTPASWSAHTPGPYGASASAQTPGAAVTPYGRGDGMSSRALHCRWIGLLRAAFRS
jgi:transcription elongation factor SPT5